MTAQPQFGKPLYPGDTVLIVHLERGNELGDVRVQQYALDQFRCATFLPGCSVQSPGDTAKVEPEIAAYRSTKLEARACFDGLVDDALADGWRFKE